MPGQVLKTRRLLNPRHKGAYRGVKKYQTLSRKVRRSQGGSETKIRHYLGRHYARKKARAMGAAMRVHNRSMTPKQIKYFGTARQKAALHRSNAGRYSFRKTKKLLRKHGYGIKSSQRRKYAMRAGSSGSTAGRRLVDYYSGRSNPRGMTAAIKRVERAAERAMGAVRRAASKRRKNVGQILTVIPANPGRRRKMASTTKRRNRSRSRNRGRVRNRRRSFSHHRRSSRNPKVVVRYRNRARHNRHHRRRNPNYLTGNAGAVVGILGGAAVTKIISGFLPANLTTGPVGYLTTGAVALGLGQVAGRVFKNRQLGNWITVGGLLIVGLQLAGQFFPQLQLPFGLSSQGGMGLLTSSNFYVPQVNLPGSMASFVTPAGIPMPVVVPATAMKGLGAMNQGLRRVGRLR